MSTPRAGNRPTVRLAGACGVASAVLVLAAPGVAAEDVARRRSGCSAGCCCCRSWPASPRLARDAGGRAAWVAPAIPAAGAVLVALHLVTVGIEHTANGLSKSSPAHEPLHEVGGALFSLGMLPFGVALVAAAVAGLARALPRWLAGAALVVGLVSVVNGTMLGTESAWGFLLSTVWVFAAGVTLAVRGATVAPSVSRRSPPTDARSGGRLVGALPTRVAVRRRSARRARASSGPARPAVPRAVGP